jgi:hypothetical protein
VRKKPPQWLISKVLNPSRFSLYKKPEEKTNDFSAFVLREIHLDGMIVITNKVD